MSREKLEAITLIVLMAVLSGIIVFGGFEAMHGLPSFVLSLGAAL